MLLNDLNLYEKGRITFVDASFDIKRRLMDIGFNKGVYIKPILDGKSMRAYSIKGSVIAIRKEDTSKIEVEI